MRTYSAPSSRKRRLTMRTSCICRLTGITCVLFILLACAAEPIQQPLNQAQSVPAMRPDKAPAVKLQRVAQGSNRDVCFKEAPLGSRIKRLRCYSQGELSQKQQEAQEWLQHQRRSQAIQPGLQ